jgi:hypothetical protein
MSGRFGIRFKVIWSIDVDLAQALGDEIEERAHRVDKCRPPG